MEKRNYSGRWAGRNGGDPAWRRRRRQAQGQPPEASSEECLIGGTDFEPGSSEPEPERVAGAWEADTLPLSCTRLAVTFILPEKVSGCKDRRLLQRTAGIG